MARDDEKHIYQLKTLQQRGIECTMHAERNLFFGLAMLSNDQQDFLSYYQRMVDSNSYEAFANNVGCSKEGGDRLFPQIAEFFRNYADWRSILPPLSDEYFKEIIRFSSYTFSDSGIEQLGEKKEKIFVNHFYEPTNLLIKKIIQDTESKEPSTDEVFDTGIFISQRGTHHQYYQAVKTLNQKPNFTIPLYLHMNIITTMDHVTGLIINKINNKIDYIFLDSYNVNFKNNNFYKKTLYSIERLSSNQDYINKTTIRSFYVWSKIRFDNYPFDKSELYSINKKMTSLQPYGLFTDEFFTKYYKEPFCKIIKSFDDTKVDEAYKKIKNQLLDKFNCLN